MFVFQRFVTTNKHDNLQMMLNYLTLLFHIAK